MTRVTCPRPNSSSSGLPHFASQISKEQLNHRAGSLPNMYFRFFFLGELLVFGNITIRGMTTAITSEALSRSGP
jgi:hypothetical protein